MCLLIYLLLGLPGIYKVRSILGPMGLLELLALCIVAPVFSLIYVLYLINRVRF
jgi:hypothetical protein